MVGYGCKQREKKQTKFVKIAKPQKVVNKKR